MQAESTGQRIRRARTRQGLSQTELAQRVRVSQPTIANWEQDSHAPRMGAPERVAEILGVETSWLMNGGDKRNGHAAGSFLAMPIRQAPLFDWPDADHVFDPKRLEPRDYFAIATRCETCFALSLHDPAVNAAFPEGSIVIFDGAPQHMADGDFHLFSVDGRYMVRRWRSTPERLQPSALNGDYETIFLDRTPRSFGRAIYSIRAL